VIVEEVRKSHANGRPVLVGTRTVEESETLAAMLTDISNLVVLNAKNDEQEAEIIACAGRLGAVTISTNMAGRGVDIRLGAGNEAEYRRVCELGGLYVIGTNRFESVRIDHQLRGRAGRQGDPGESRFFVSLQDDLMIKYRLTDCLPRKVRDAAGTEPLHNAALGRAIAHIQRVCEGQAMDARIILERYSAVVEEQRKIVYDKRMDILTGHSSLNIEEKQNHEKVNEILRQITPEEYRRVQKCIELFAINRCWADHLVECESATDEIPVIGQANGDPFSTFTRRLITAFSDMQQRILQTMQDLFSQLIVHDGKIDLIAMGVRGPSSTRTYLISDGTENVGMPISADIGSAVNLPLYLFYLCVERFHRNKE
jgi:preprotein translocase subunit SecA